MPQRLFIPYIGSVIVLTEDWSFDLFFEGRNHPLIGALYTGPKFEYKPGATGHSWTNQKYEERYLKKQHGTRLEDWHADPRYKVEKAMTEEEKATTTRTHRWTRRKDNPYIAATLPAGTPLRIDRVYIKKGIDAYSSITFVVAKECKDKKIRGKRFWAKLRDVNKIVCEPI